MKLHDIQDNLGVKSMSDLTTKAIKDICGTKTPSKKKRKKWKMQDIWKKYHADLTGIYIL